MQNIDEEDFQLLIQYLEEIDGAEIIDSSDGEGIRRNRLKSKYKDEITISYYNTKTLLIQGRPLYLFQEAKLFLYELLPLEQVAATESKTYKIDIKADKIRDELKAFMPTAVGFLDEKILKILTPALSLRKIDIDIEDYSSFAFPALRGLEGYIKQLLQTKGSDENVRYVKKLARSLMMPKR